ncbi:hypothetical protein HBH62_253700, partial [Parastagonospora nodorum]
MYWRLTRPVASLLGTFATLGIDQSSDKRSDSAETQSSDNKGKERRLERECGLKNRFEDCWYLVGKGKPQGRTPTPEIREKSSRAIETQIISTDYTNKQSSLINRWTLGPGSNTRVTNTRAYSWKKRADAK